MNSTGLQIIRRGFYETKLVEHKGLVKYSFFKWFNSFLASLWSFFFDFVDKIEGSWIICYPAIIYLNWECIICFMKSYIFRMGTFDQKIYLEEICLASIVWMLQMWMGIQWAWVLILASKVSYIKVSFYVCRWIWSQRLTRHAKNSYSAR